MHTLSFLKQPNFRPSRASVYILCTIVRNVLLNYDAAAKHTIAIV